MSAAVPGLANLWLNVTKDTALLAVIGFIELTKATSALQFDVLERGITFEQQVIAITRLGSAVRDRNRGADRNLASVVFKRIGQYAANS